MQVSGSGQMMQNQMQVRKMDGTGGGNGQMNGADANGMKDIMQSLSPEDRATLQDKMSSLSPEERQSKIQEMKQVDSSSTSSSGDYLDALLNALGEDDSKEDSTNSTSTSFYA